MGVLTQSVLDQNHVMQSGNDGEEESRAKEDRAGNPDPLDWFDLQQQHEKHSADLRERIGFSKNAWPEITQPSDGEQDSACRQDGDIATEDEYGVLPRNLVQDREHQK